MPGLPKFWVGYVFSAVFFIVALSAHTVTLSPNEISAANQGIGLLCLGYWLGGVVRLHEICLRLDAKYPIRPSRAFWFHLIPFFMFYWFFKWPITMVQFIKGRNPKCKLSGWVPGSLITLGFIIAWRVDGAIGYMMLVFAGQLLTKELRTLLATPPASSVHLKVG